ncbi:hypothetical protein LguiA_036427 [Lonicera macranthoides]
MSNNLLSQQLSLPNGQMGQREPVSEKVDSSALAVSIGMLGTVSNNATSHQFAVSNQPMGPMQKANLNNLGSQNTLLPSKRKASVEPLSDNNLLPHQPSVPNKRVAQREPLPGSTRPSTPNKKTVQMQPMSGTPSSLHLQAANKRMIRNDSISKSGSQRVQTPKNRTQPMEPSPKARAESFEAVRSKMRESLAAALALVISDQDNKASNEQTGSPQERKGESQRGESSSVHVDTSAGISTNESLGNSVLPSKHDGGQESQSNVPLPDGDVSFSDSFFVKDELLQGNGLSWAWDMDMVAAEAKEIQTIEKPELVPVDVVGDGGEKPVRSATDLASKIEIELFKLYGGVNKKYKEKGRSLMFNLKDRNNPELRERVMSGDITPERLCSMTAEELASKELSEWRVAKAQELAEMIVLPDSDVDPRRLVKKTHKGEYQVEVEQDDGISVEVSVGTSFTQIRQNNKEKKGQPSSEVKVTSDKQSTQGRKNGSETEDVSCSLTIPADGTDLMQGLIVDELKDAEFLPPIVSLDEFMESLDSEPPFENITADAGQTESPSSKENLQTGDVMPNDPPSKDPVDTKPDKAETVELKSTELEVKLKSRASPVERKSSPPGGSLSMGEHVWEGAIQLNISAQVSVTGFFRSGEKTSTTEWPTSLEIKGRVRLDAFEKFLQELPMSRSRAVMVAHFVLKDTSSEFDRASFKEVVDSYVADERLGFAEPAPGIELYFCPTHPKILEILTKRLLKDQTEILNSTDNGLIGIVVWRRPHFTSVISPNSSSSHHKHGSKKQHNLITARKQEQDMNVNMNLTKTPAPFGQRYANTEPPLDDEDDDIPPGFGPGNARDEDDLPEFNFSGNLNSSMPKFPTGISPIQQPQSSQKPVDQMRELIQRYGQTGAGNLPERRGAGAGVVSKPWNDDDDDIPEWDPQAQRQLPQLQPPIHGFNQPMQPHKVNQHLGLAGPVHPLAQAGSPAGVQSVAPSWPQGGRWANPLGPHGQVQGSLGNQPSAGQQYGLPVLRAGRPGTDQGRGVPRSRGY